MMSTPSPVRTLWRITVSPRRPQLDAHGYAVLRDIHDLGFSHIDAVAFSRLFLLQGPLAPPAVEQIARDLLADPVTEAFSCRQGGDDPGLPGNGFDAAVEVHLKGGVMDPVAASTLMAIRDMSLAGPEGRAKGQNGARSASEGFVTGSTGGLSAPHAPEGDRIRLSTARLYRLGGVRTADEAVTIARRLLANDCIEDIYITAPGRHDPRPDHLPIAPTRPFALRHVAIRDLDDAALMKLSREGHLFLSLDEMRAIQSHYRAAGREPTDLELETFAQTWSEHCVHKTLKSAVRYHGAPMPHSELRTQNAEPSSNVGPVEVTYENLLRDTIARATRELIAAGTADWCLSVFEDNAGIIAFDDQYGIAFKAETHNHPSAIEPYGGAATGIGGCIRDIMGCGLGAKPIANTDVFCVANPDFPADALPKGVLHPRRILKGVVSGVRDYGNRMGIPTVNGAIVFDDRYLGNPLVFCGCIGLIPRDRIRKEPRPGDLVVVIGGRTGRDGIHGATFSSAELTDTHADEFSHAVQIGNAITQKQVLDAQLAARDHASGCLYTAVTDCGAGGLSSAVGEMGSKLGATVDLEKVPLKYSGLRYDEIWISEAQERMVFSVPPNNWPAFKAICDAENVEATAIGEFRSDGRLILRYAGTTVGEIDCHFLHEGIPRMRRDAAWQIEPEAQARGSRGDAADNQDAQEPGGSRNSKTKPEAQAKDSSDSAAKDRENQGPRECEGGHQYQKSAIGKRQSETNRQSAIRNPQLTCDSLLALLRRLNTASKEWVIRQYDHEVQGGSVIKPLVGPGQGPSDAAVIRPVLGSNKGIAIGCGICPTFVEPASSRSYADPDPYWMAIAAIDEAIRNVVCVGGDPRRTAILDNFCWGNCDDPQNMGALVRACQACYDAAIAYGAPFISGKDSLNNEFAIDPADAQRLTARIPLVNNRIRIPGTLLVSAISIIEDVSRCVTADLKPDEGSRLYFLGAPERTWGEPGGHTLSRSALLHETVAKWIAAGQVVAAHDVSDGGILCAIAEMALAGRCGVRVQADTGKGNLLSAIPSGYVVQTSQAVGKPPPELMWLELGRPQREERMDVDTGTGKAWNVTLADLTAAWRQPLGW